MEYKIISGHTLIPQSIQSKFKSKNRALSFYQSRMALLECLKSYNIDLTIEELKIDNNHYLKNHPQMLVSISHTANVGASIVAQNNECKSIGIDIEFKARIINPKIQKFFLTSHDNGHQNLLDLWVKKEAAFKALSPLIKHQIVLTDIWINETKFGFIGNNELIGELKTFEQLVLGQPLLIATSHIF